MVTATKKKPKAPAKRVGGPSGKNTGTQVKFWATGDAQKERWKKAAKDEGLAFNEWIRDALNARSKRTQGG
jgi:hypothetical protein